MNPEPLTPLVKGDEDPFERALLRAGQRERAPRGADRRLLAALGVGGGSALSALLGTYASKIGAKGALATVAVSVVAVAAATWVVSSSQHATEVPAPVPVSEPPPSAAPSSTDVRAEALPSTRVEDLPTSPPPASKIAGKPSTSVATGTVTSTARAEPVEPAGGLAREVELVQTARAALARGDTGEALRTLDVHDREFPRGTLRPESRVLRIETLVRSGGAQELARANALGDAFLREHPSGPQARRVRAVLGREP